MTVKLGWPSRRLLAGSVLILLFPLAVPADEILKSDTATPMNQAGSWVGGSVPGTNDLARWDQTVTIARNAPLGGDLSWAGIVYRNPGAAYTIPGGAAPGTLTLGAAGIDMALATNNFTINTNVVLAANQSWTVAAGRTLTVGGPLSGSATLTKTDAGTLALTGANSEFGGSLILAGGTLSGNANGLGGPTGTLRVSATTTLTPSAAVTFAAPRALTLDAGTTLTINPTAANSLVVDGVIGGAGALAMTGAGALTLNAANTNTGPITISAGVLRAQAGVGIPSGAGSGNLTVTGGVWETSGTIARATGVGGGEVQLPGGTSGFSAFGNPLTVNLGGGAALTWGAGSFAPGILVLNSAAATHDLQFENAIALNSSAARTVQVNARTATLAGMLSNTGSGGLTKTGDGALSLTEANAYTGMTTVSKGVLRAHDGVGLPAGGGITLAGGVWENDQDIARNLGSGLGLLSVGSGASGFSAAGAPIAVNLNGGAPLSWGSGGFAPGTLVLNAATANDKVTILNAMHFGAAARILQVNTNVAELSGSLSGSGGLTKTGAGTLLLSGANAWTGGVTTVSAGTLQLAADYALPGGNLTITDNAVLDLQNTTQTVATVTLYAGTIAGSGRLTSAGYVVGVNHTSGTIAARLGGAGVPLTKVDSGTFTLTGTNDYSGTLAINNGTLVVTEFGDTLNGAGGIELGASTTSAGTLVYAGAADIVLATRVLILVATTTGGGTLESSGDGTVTVRSGIVSPNPGIKTFTLAGTNASTNTFAAAIDNGSDTIDLAKSGAGRWILTGANTYRHTTVNGGVLQVGNGTTAASLGSGSITVASPGSLTFHQPGEVPLGTAITGTGAVTKEGDGTLVLNAASTFSGGLAVHGGTVAYGIANALPALTVSGDVTLDAATTLDLRLYSGTIGALHGEGTVDNSAGAGAMTFGIGNNGRSGTFGGTIRNSTGTIALTKLGGGVQTLTSTNTYSGATTVSAGMLRLGAPDILPNGAGKGLLDTGASLARLFDLAGHDETVNGLSGAGVVTNSAGDATLTIGDADTGASATCSLRDGGGVLRLVKVGAGTQTLGGVAAHSGGITLAGGALVLNAINTFGGGVTITGGMLAMAADTGLGAAANGVVFSGDGVLSNSAAFTLAATRSIAIASNATATFAGNGANTLTVAAPIGGEGLLAKAGAHTLVLAADNTYAGLTTIGGGTLQVGAGGATGSLGTGDTLNHAALVFNRTGTLTYAGAIGGTGSLTKNAAAGTVILEGTNRYEGLTTVSAGALNVRHASGLGSTTGATTVAANAALELQGGIAVGAEALSLSGTGMATAGALRSVSGTNAFGGPITLVTASRINVDADMLTLQGAVGGTLGLTVGGAGTLVLGAPLATGSTLTKDGAGTAVLAADNTYTTTTISGGTLRVGTGGASGNLGSGNTTDNGSLVFNRTGTYTYSGLISGSGSLIQEGPGTITLGGANSYAGATTVLAGSLVLNGAHTAAATGLVTIRGGTLRTGAAERIANGAAIWLDGGTLEVPAFTETVAALTLGDGQLAGTGTVSAAAFSMTNGTVSVALAGAGALVQGGTGTVTLAAASTYGGGTTVNGGVLRVINAAGSATGTGPVTIRDGATLAGAGAIAGAVTLHAGATLRPGTSVGTLTTGALQLDAGATVQLEFNALDHDRVTVTNTGGLGLDGGGIFLDAEGTTNAWAVNGIYSVMQYSGPLGGAGAEALTVLNPAPGKEYTFRAADGSVWLTISDLGLPDVTNGGGASGITAHGATFNGFLVSTGGLPTAVAIYGGAADGGTTPAHWDWTNSLGTRAAGDFAASAPPPWLAAGTMHFYRCFATNAAGAAWAASTTSFVTRAETDATEAAIDTDVRNASYERGPSPNTVFLDHAVGYAFFVLGPAGAGGSVAFRKTLDGGATWSAPVSLGDDQDDGHVAVWYDRWTPGDSGTRIHLAHIGSGNDTLRYNVLDTADDTLGAWRDVRAATANWAAGYAGCSIAKTTTGRLFIYAGGVFGATSNALADSIDGTAWTVADPGELGLVTDAGQLLPLAGGDALFLQLCQGTDRLRTTVWSNSLSAWNPWITNATMDVDTTYLSQWGAALDPRSSNVYAIVHTDVNGASGDLMAYAFTARNSAWSAQGRIADDTARQIVSATLAVDPVSGDLYAVYARQVGAAVGSNPTNVFLEVRHSGDGGRFWSAPRTISTATGKDIRSVRANHVHGARLYAVWFDTDNNDMFGNTIVDLAPTTLRISNGRVDPLQPRSAGLHGFLRAEGLSPARVTLYWGETDGGTVSNDWLYATDLGTPGTGALFATVGPLAHISTNFYRFYATNAQGDVWADTAPSFRTPLDLVFIGGTNYWGRNMDFEIDYGFADGNPAHGWYQDGHGDAFSYSSGNQGITPIATDGTQMMRFDAADGGGSNCDIYQLVDLRDYAEAITNGNAFCAFSAYLNGAVAGNRIDVILWLQDESRATLTSYATSGFMDGDLNTWERFAAGPGVVSLPPNARYAVLSFKAYADGQGFPLSGHYADQSTFEVIFPNLIGTPPTGLIVVVH